MNAVVLASEPVLRPMRESDLAGVYAVEAVAYQFPWTPGIFRDCLRVGYECHVYETPGGLVGHGIMSVAGSECHLLNICIHPDFQRRGLGRALVECLLDLARRRGARLALLEVRVSNTAGYGLYNALGFNEVGLRKDYYPARLGREDAIILALDLVSSAAG